MEEEGGTKEGGEAGGATPPLSKKAPEGAILAFEGGVIGLDGPVRLLVAAATPVMKVDCANRVITTILNLTNFVVECAADEVRLHVGVGDTVGVIRKLSARAGGAARTGCRS